MEMDRILQNCSGAIGIADDIAVYGSIKEEQDRNLDALMITAWCEGLVFNLNKCYMKKTDITFSSNVYGRQVIWPGPHKVQDLKTIPQPENKAELQHFIGFMTYLSRFIKSFNVKFATFRDLLKKGSDFLWEPPHLIVFDHLKKEVLETSLLHYYQPGEPVYLQSDASL